MQSANILTNPTVESNLSNRFTTYLRLVFAGLLIPLGFAPIHLPGLMLLGLAIAFHDFPLYSLKRAFAAGFALGLAMFGFGVSWVYVSIHQYGGLNPVVSSLITVLFIGYLALYPALVAAAFSKARHLSEINRCLCFASLWVLCEYLRSNLFTGFPWLLVGTGLFDTPMKHLLPVVGTYGNSFLGCFGAGMLSLGLVQRKPFWLVGFVLYLLLPGTLKHQPWVELKRTPISVGVIQANLSMRNKWDDQYFWHLVDTYMTKTTSLLKQKTELIVMPESAIPVPPHYLEGTLQALDSDAKEAHSAILFGMPTVANSMSYHNTLRTLGTAKGLYAKQHLVPFGEYFPKPLQPILKSLGIPDANIQPGESNQPLITVGDYPIASLICYELGYPQLLRKQLPDAAWIVSVSDDGWFGHSLAAYQQLQMSQALSVQAGRYQVVANNDGLSSIINAKGELEASLPAYSDGILTGNLYPASGATPWAIWGDLPVLVLAVLILVFVGGRSLGRNDPVIVARKERSGLRDMS